MEFNEDECRVLKQLFDRWVLQSGDTVTEEIKSIDNASYVVGFKPDPEKGEVRLGRTEWKDFVSKLKKIVGE